jgi:hypothetical protein
VVSNSCLMHGTYWWCRTVMSLCVKLTGGVQQLWAPCMELTVRHPLSPRILRWLLEKSVHPFWVVWQKWL